MKRIALITDIHLDEPFPIEKGVNTRQNWTRILEDVASRNIEEIIFAGDMGLDASQPWIFNSMKEKGFRFQVILGNHDTFTSTIRSQFLDFPEDISEFYYSNEDEDFKYIFLDTSTSNVSTTQLYWLENELITEKEIVLLIHHPILDTGTATQRTFPLEGSEAVRQLLLSIQNKVHIFCGHLHCLDERSEANINQFITPAASFQASKDPDTSGFESTKFGYRIISIDRNNLDSEVIMFNP